MRTPLPAVAGMFLLAALGAGTASPQAPAQDPAPAQATTPTTILRTTVRRVVLDVVVSDKKGTPVSGLTRDDFSLDENGHPQRILSFEPHGFESAMDYMPPKLPPEPPNTFLNLPATPEKGPLYVLLYDLNNMDNEDQMALTVNQHNDQMFGRQQLLKFIQSKPEGARFEIYVWSDRLQLLQGFTSDKAQLYKVVDPKNHGPHIPQVYLMGQNTGRGDPDATLAVLNRIGSALDGLPGRKNLIWFSGGFPIQIFPTNDDGPKYQQESKATLDLLARNQIAIYPVDVRGVVFSDWHGTSGLSDEGGTFTSSAKALGSSAPGAGSNAAAGASLLRQSYFTEDEIAHQTGGRAFYSSNDVADELTQATEAGEAFYTLTYSPTDHNYNGDLRHIKVELEKKGYTLEYRQSYYATPSPQDPGPGIPAKHVVATKVSKVPETPHRPLGDSLSANMQLGAPIVHGLLFGVQVHTAGAPAQGTPEEMASLATEPAYFKLRRRLAAGKPLAPIPLQHYSVGFRIFARQFNTSSTPLDLDIAVAAYDADGNLLNASVSIATESVADTTVSQPSRVFRVDQQFPVPLAATTLRFAVRDDATDRLGAMEIKLPLAPETQTASTAPPATP